MKCGDLMHTDLQWVPSNASAREVARIMRDRSLGFLLVFGTSPGQLAGVVTDRDLAIRVCAEEKRSEEVRVIDIATTDVIACGEGEDLKEAERKMKEEQKSRLVVVNSDGQTVGILSLTDILLGDRPDRAIKTARGVLAREAEGPHTPIEQIKLTPSTPEDEEAASHQGSVTIGRTLGTSVKIFP
jgi:CBS domain-containing protein